MYAKHATYLRRDRSTPTSAVSIASRLSNSGPRVSSPTQSEPFPQRHRLQSSAARVLRLMFPMISFSRISKQYGRQVLFVDASFQLNPGEKVGLVGPERRRKDDAVPDDRRRGSAGRRGRVRPEETDDRVFPPGRGGDVRPIRPRRGDRRQRTRRRSAPRARGAECTPWRIRRAPDEIDDDPRRASARSRRSTSISAATRSRARRAKCCTASASTTSGSTAMSARCRAAGRCGSRWPACCSGGRTSC